MPETAPRTVEEQPAHNDIEPGWSALRRCHNRIAHHEPSFHRPLSQLQDETIEAMGWMCADTSTWTLHLGKFVEVYTVP